MGEGSGIREICTRGLEGNIAPNGKKMREGSSDICLEKRQNKMSAGHKKTSRMSVGSACWGESSLVEVEQDKDEHKLMDCGLGL